MIPARRRVGLLAVPLVALSVGALGLAPADAAVGGAGTPGPVGSVGSGDTYFPRQGNGGYDVAHYALALAYRPATRHLGGTALITARATQSLQRFDLDLRRWMRVRSVFVDGAPARFDQPAALQQELVITPVRPLRAGHRFHVLVSYAGTARPVIDPDGSPDGFIPTDDGAFVASEPQGSPSWFPCNDTPTDKATVSVSMTVPRGLAAIGNGALRSRRSDAHMTTWSWQLLHPVSTYLMTASVGRFTLRRGRTAGGIPFLEAVDSRLAGRDQVLRFLPGIVGYFGRVYGRYPFGSTGVIIDHAPRVGYALETATRPVFDRVPDVATLAHELAHQWYGDDVTLRRWRDIWLNEGFAQFSTWLWGEHTGGPTTAQRLAGLLRQPASSAVWNPPPGNPRDAANLFSSSVYARGAGALAALREKLGDETFFRIMRGWLVAHRYGSATVPDFTDYAQHVAHRDLYPFFQNWLYRPGKPRH